MRITNLDNVRRTKVAGDDVFATFKQTPIGSADGAPNFSIRVFTLEPGGHTPYHSHPWEHENYVISGEGVITTAGGKERPIYSGDFALILPEEEHQFRNTSTTENLKFICLVPKEHE